VLDGFFEVDPSEAMADIYVWMRYSASRQLTWQRNYNTQPRILSAAQVSGEGGGGGADAALAGREGCCWCGEEEGGGARGKKGGDSVHSYPITDLATQWQEGGGHLDIVWQGSPGAGWGGGVIWAIFQATAHKVWLRASDLVIVTCGCYMPHDLCCVASIAVLCRGLCRSV